MDLEHMVINMCQAAKTAARGLATTSSQAKNEALLTSAAALRRDSHTLLAANAQDVEAGRGNGLSAALLDRLTLTEERIEGMAKGWRLLSICPTRLARR